MASWHRHSAAAEAHGDLSVRVLLVLPVGYPIKLAGLVAEPRAGGATVVPCFTTPDTRGSELCRLVGELCLTVAAELGRVQRASYRPLFDCHRQGCPTGTSAPVGGCPNFLFW